MTCSSDTKVGVNDLTQRRFLSYQALSSYFKILEAHSHTYSIKFPPSMLPDQTAFALPKAGICANVTWKQQYGL